MTRTLLLIPLLLSLLACGLFTEDPGDSTSYAMMSRPSRPYVGNSTLEEKVIEHNTIVRATMTSFSSDVVLDTDSFYGDGSDNRHRPVYKFSLSVTEYLKGTGPDDIVAVWMYGNSFETSNEAIAVLNRELQERDAQWDNREAIIFLDHGLSGGGTVLDTLLQRTDHFTLALGDRDYSDDRYSLHSEWHKDWLPAVSTATSTGDGQEFLLDVPPTNKTVTLGDLKTLITDITAEYTGGDGSKEYRDCVLSKYRWIRHDRNVPEVLGRPHASWSYINHTVDSGQPAGTTLIKRQNRNAQNGSSLFWFEGGDSHLFGTATSTATTDRDGDGELDYFEIVRLMRPLPAGQYSSDLKEDWAVFRVCNFISSSTWTVTVTPPEGTLHEFFFDPVTVGSAVAADTSNGVLKPTSFSGINGATTTISAIAWEPSSTSSEPVSGSVKVEVATSDLYAALDEQVLEFIQQDGSVSLTLDVFDATVEPQPDTQTHTLSWPVSSQPWDSGDELMVRIRKAPLSCRSRAVVPNARTNPGLVSDCEALLSAKDALAGTATLSWGLTTSIADWDGVTVRGTPRRVTRLDLGRSGLTGKIPPELGELSALTDLYLSGNRLTGEIPSELGQLSELVWLFLHGNRLSGEIPSELGGLTNLRRLYLQDNGLTGSIPPGLGGLTNLFHLWLYGNRLGGTIPWELVNLTGLELLQLGGNGFTGCVPQGLRDIRLNDIGSLGLADCSGGVVSAPTGLEVSISGGTFSLTWSAVTGAGLYEAQYVEGSGGDWDVIGTTTATSTGFAPDGGPACGSTYRFRVRAYGDTQTHAAGWGPESAVVPVTTASCNRPPEFATSTYSFRIAEDAATSTLVGTVSATDADDDMLEYRITSGNPAGSFSVGTTTGEIAVAGTLDHETTSSHSLTIEASDGRGGSATATVRILVTDVAEDAPPAPAGVRASLTGGEFTLSWNVVEGASHYETQYRDDPSGDWEVIGTTTATSTAYSPEGGPACGTIYRFRVRAYGDGLTYAPTWGAESDEEPVTTGACNRAPEFSTSTYSFTIAENAATSTVLGSVSATDPDGDAVYYNIVGGNRDRRFAINAGHGIITLIQSLDYEDTSSYTLTVEASDRDEPTEGATTATVEISVTDVAEDAPPAPSGLSVTLEDGEFSLSWDVVSGTLRYEAQYRDDPTGDWSPIGTTTTTTLSFAPTGGEACGTTYDFRVRAYGDGETYISSWGAESDTESMTAGACNRPPVFATSTRSFTVSEDAATTTSVGTVSATDPDGDTLTYSIAAGNDGGVFDIGENSGQLTVAGALDHASRAFHMLTVVVDDGQGGTATATVAVTLILSDCSNGTVVRRPADNPVLVRDCSLLLAARDTLAGDGSLDWSADVAISDWQGITEGLTSVHNSPRIGYVSAVILSGQELTGTVPPELGGLHLIKHLSLSRNSLTGEIPSELAHLFNLKHLLLNRNSLTGEIPSALGGIEGLQNLYLNGNSLSGRIPPELGDLRSLRSLILDDNSLTGGIPSELGGMTALEQLYVRDNGLTGEIPQELESLPDLDQLFLDGNDFTGCIPAGLRDVEEHDLERLGLDYCS